MSVARDLAGLERSLREHPEIDLFAPIHDGGLLASAEVSQLLGSLPATWIQGAPSIVRLCLQALRVQYREAEPHAVSAELVATLPEGMPGAARPTAQVLREMIGSSLVEIILLG